MPLAEACLLEEELCHQHIRPLVCGTEKRSYLQVLQRCLDMQAGFCTYSYELRVVQSKAGAGMVWCLGPGLKATEVPKFPIRFPDHYKGVACIGCSTHMHFIVW